MKIAALVLAAALLPTPLASAGPVTAAAGVLSFGTPAIANGTLMSAAPAAEIRLTLPAPAGRHPIGTVSLHLIDSSRPDPWVPSQKRRELMAQIWYPAATVRGYPRAPWVSPQIANLAIPLPQSPEEEQAMLAEALAVRVADTRFVLDHLTTLTRGHHPAGPPLPRGLAATLDMGRAGMAGHSMGGATAADVMRADRRVRAGANLDGTFFGRVLTTGLSRPFLMLGSNPADGEQDETWTRMWDRLRGPRHWLQLDNTAHMSLTDLQTLLPQLRTPAPDSEPLIGSIDDDRSIAVQRAYVLAFFDRHLRHGDGRLLTGPSARFPEMQFLP